VEALNKVLKYSYLPRRKTMNLSSLASLLIETFLPEAHQKYLCMNYMQTGRYRKYKSFVPGYLQDRPRSTIIHCLERKSKALKYSGEDITTVGDQKGTFEVRGSSSKTHKVDFGLHTQMPSCTCADWTQWHIPCKHFFCSVPSGPHMGLVQVTNTVLGGSLPKYRSAIP